MADRKKKKYSSGSDIMMHAGAIVIIILLNYVLSFSFGRYDLTEDKRYSLSPNTIELLENEERLSDRIFFRIYLDGDLPADLRKVRNSIQEMLDEFIIYAGDKVQYEFIDPNGTDDEDYNLEVQNQLSQDGLQWCMIDLISGTEREQKIIWPAAVVEYGGITMDKIQFFRGGKIESEQQLQYIATSTISKLEYLLVSAIRRVTETKKKSVSFLHGHGELAENEAKDVRMDLGEYYILNDIEINGQINALNNTDLLIIARPQTRFSEKDKFVIDQFIMRGGKVMWSIDPLVIPRDSLLNTGQTIGMSANLNVEKDMLYKYGVRLNADVVLDETCGPYFIPQSQEIIEWYFYPLLNRADHIITKNLDPIRSEYPGSIDLVNESDTTIKKTVLLSSTANSRVFKAPARINYMITQVEPDFNDPEQGDFPIAVLLEGRFTSAFKNVPISDAFLSSPDYKTLFEGSESKMVVISDGDIMRNAILDSAWTGRNWVYKFVPISRDMYGETNKDGTPKYVYDNKNFILNTVDYLLEDNSLIDIRTKSITLRQLDKERVAENKELWRMINVLLPLLALMILAVVQIFVRKKKFASGSV